MSDDEAHPSKKLKLETDDENSDEHNISLNIKGNVSPSNEVCKISVKEQVVQFESEETACNVEVSVKSYSGREDKSNNSRPEITDEVNKIPDDTEILEADISLNKSEHQKSADESKDNTTDDDSDIEIIEPTECEANPQRDSVVEVKPNDGSELIVYEEGREYYQPSVLTQTTCTSWTSLPYTMLLERKMEEVKNEVTATLHRAAQSNGLLRNWINMLKSSNIKTGIELFPIVKLPVCKEYMSSCTFTIGVHDMTKKRVVGYCKRCPEPLLPKGFHCCYCANELPKSFIRTAKIFEDYLQFCDEDASTNDFWRHFTVRSSLIGELMVIVEVNEAGVSQKEMKSKMEELRQFFEEQFRQGPNVVSLYYVSVLNGKERAELLMGDSYLTENIYGKKFQISPLSYFLPCTQGAKAYFKVIEDLLKLDKNTTLLDIGCGVGAFSIMAASKCKQVFCLDSNETAVLDACVNAANNGCTNCQFLHGNTQDVLTRVKLRLGPDDKDVVAVIHPQNFTNVHAVRKLSQIKKLVYVASQASLVKKLIRLFSCQLDESRGVNDPFIPAQAVPIDMYPLALHSFLVVCFIRKSFDNVPSAEKPVQVVVENVCENVTSVPSVKASPGNAYCRTKLQPVVQISERPTLSTDTSSQLRSHNAISANQTLSVPSAGNSIINVQPVNHTSNTHLPHKASLTKDKERIRQELLKLYDFQVSKARTIMRERFYQLYWRVDQTDWNKILTDEFRIIADAVYTQMSSRFPLLSEGSKSQERVQLENTRQKPQGIQQRPQKDVQQRCDDSFSKNRTGSTFHRNSGDKESKNFDVLIDDRIDCLLSEARLVSNANLNQSKRFTHRSSVSEGLTSSSRSLHQRTYAEEAYAQDKPSELARSSVDKSHEPYSSQAGFSRDQSHESSSRNRLSEYFERSVQSRRENLQASTSVNFNPQFQSRIMPLMHDDETYLGRKMGTERRIMPRPLMHDAERYLGRR